MNRFAAAAFIVVLFLAPLMARAQQQTDSQQQTGDQMQQPDPARVKQMTQQRISSVQSCAADKGLRLPAPGPMVARTLNADQQTILVNCMREQDMSVGQHNSTPWGNLSISRAQQQNDQIINNCAAQNGITLTGDQQPTPEQNTAIQNCVQQAKGGGQ